MIYLEAEVSHSDTSTHRLLFNTIISYVKQIAFRKEASFIKMLPGAVGKAVVLCVTFALTSTAAVGMII